MVTFATHLGGGSSSAQLRKGFRLLEQEASESDAGIDTEEA